MTTEPKFYVVECGLCGGEAVFLGTLGVFHHYRCRQCGMHTSREADNE